MRNARNFALSASLNSSGPTEKTSHKPTSPSSSKLNTSLKSIARDNEYEIEPIAITTTIEDYVDQTFNKPCKVNDSNKILP